MAEAPELLDAERLALAVAKSRLADGKSVGPNVTTMLVAALERITGRRDWRVR